MAHDAPQPGPDDESEVRAAVQAFYGAFAAMDLKAMTECWARRAADICIHPGWEVLEGWPAVREAWRAIFANTGFMRFEIEDLRVELLGDLARVTCVESIFTVAGVHTAHSQVATTKLLLRTPNGWKITLHHGSPLAMHHTVQELDLDEPAN